MSDPTNLEYCKEPASFQIIAYDPYIYNYDDDFISYATPTKSNCTHQHQQQRQQCQTTLREDRYWSILSNSFFVAGCFFSLIGNSWDYILYTKFNNVEGDLQAMSEDKWQYVTYQSLSILWPFIFLMNSIIDVKWALVVQERMKQNSSKPWKSFLHKLLVDPTQGRKRNSLLLNTALVVPQNVLRRTRNHIGHRRQLGAASAFGIAASLSVSAAVLSVIRKDSSFGRDHWNSLSYWTNVLKYASVHMYLISAILTLWKFSPTSSVSSYCYCGGGRSGSAVGDGCGTACRWLSPTESSESSSNRSALTSNTNSNVTKADATTSSCGEKMNQQTPTDQQGIVLVSNTEHVKWYSNVEFLGTLGDVIFGIATVVDVFLQDVIYHEDEIFVWPIVQAAVWSVDALLYLRSDFLSLYYVSAAYLWKDPCGQYV